ncbi:hypothetical protein V6N12_058423 [Hibiscus sabdariffa]|uniref:Uncharacterized protein n=1 Tax=Hibiscus sabdariffa TaxID=183260 RepID=A0ABR2EW67_9ROSI
MKPGPRTRLEKVVRRPEVSNAWNFDFDDDDDETMYSDINSSRHGLGFDDINSYQVASTQGDGSSSF